MIESIKKKGVEFTPQTFGRRLKMIQNECIMKYRVTYDPAAFDIVTNILLTGKSTKKFLQELYSRMIERPIPFRSTMKISKEDQLKCLAYIRLIAKIDGAYDEREQELLHEIGLNEMKVSMQEISDTEKELDKAIFRVGN